MATRGVEISVRNIKAMRALAARAHRVPVSAINMTRMLSRVVWERSFGVVDSGELVGMFLTSARDIYTKYGTYESVDGISWLTIDPLWRNGRSIRTLTAAYLEMQWFSPNTTAATFAAQEGAYRSFGFFPATERLVVDIRRLRIWASSRETARVTRLGEQTLEEIDFAAHHKVPGSIFVDGTDFLEYLDPSMSHYGGAVFCVCSEPREGGSVVILQERKNEVGELYLNVLYSSAGSEDSYIQVWQQVSADWPDIRVFFANASISEPLIDLLEPSAKLTRTVLFGIDLRPTRLPVEQTAYEPYHGGSYGPRQSHFRSSISPAFRADLRRDAAEYFGMRCGGVSAEYTSSLSPTVSSAPKACSGTPYCQWVF